MKKSKPPKKSAVEEDAISDAGPLDWTPAFCAFKQAFDWAIDVAAHLAHDRDAFERALDIAAHLARDYPEEVAAVERVRCFMRKRFAGEPAHIRVDDILLTLALIVGAIARDLGRVAEIGPWPMRFPSATELWERVLPQRVGLSAHFTPHGFTTN